MAATPTVSIIAEITMPTQQQQEQPPLARREHLQQHSVDLEHQRLAVGLARTFERADARSGACPAVLSPEPGMLHLRRRASSGNTVPGAELSITGCGLA